MGDFCLILHASDGYDDAKIVTGKWGCGIFKGNKELKFLIQWMACTKAGREMTYLTYNDEDHFKNVERLLVEFDGKSVSEVIDVILKYPSCKQGNKKPIPFVDFILKTKVTK